MGFAGLMSLNLEEEVVVELLKVSISSNMGMPSQP